MAYFVGGEAVVGGLFESRNETINLDLVFIFLKEGVENIDGVGEKIVFSGIEEEFGYLAVVFGSEVVVDFEVYV